MSSLARSRGCAILVAALLVAPAIAEASTADDDLASARVAVEEQRYDDAIAVAGARLAEPSTTGKTRLAFLELGAVSHLVLGHETEAVRMIADLYSLAPAHELEDRSLPPRITSVFDAEAARPHARRVAVTVRPTSADVADYELRAMGPYETVTIACSPFPKGAWSPVVAAPQGAGLYRFRLPTLGKYSCFVLATDAAGLPLGRLGSRTAPITLKALDKPKTLPPEKPLTAKWWFWTAAGVLVAGATTAIVIAASPSAQPPPDASLTLGASNFR